MRGLVLATVVCALWAGTALAAETGDREALKGTWKQTVWKRDGETKDFAGTTVHVADGTMTVKHGDQAEAPVAYTLDPARKTIDLTIEQEGRTMLGIYIIEGKTLKLCFHPKERPTKIDAEAGTGNFLMEFEKE